MSKSIANSQVSSASIALWSTNISAARTTIIGQISAVTSAIDNVQNKQSSLAVAEESLAQGITGERSEDILAAEAQVTQAQGALAVARANLEKTLIRTPISGSISTLSLTRGDFVSAFTPAAIVANEGGFVITTFITANDRTRIAAGNPALIDNIYGGIVTAISPGVDPSTKKIEVTIGVTEGNVDLVRGSSVDVSISRTNGDNEPTMKFAFQFHHLRLHQREHLFFLYQKRMYSFLMK